ncbi:MAG: bifunctional folylpolyglutamate synthase/dihydrofolate synthase [Acidobacteria bacterium]|nr:bifunctional folylpolyglutamate synthase/dihydrofolate synthase [Acidobacteriota bacterium]
MNFDESLKYLYGLGNEVSAMKLGLENIGKLLTALGNPEKNFLKVQVAGTNGKGSTCAFLDSICVLAGIKTGLYTSPHLISITERIKIGSQEISEKDFAHHATKIKEISEKLLEIGDLEALPTFFEQVTAIAISAFDEAKIDLAILETGLGGRFDATTAMKAEIVAITPIDFDHQNILGNTLAEIAAEKAAIIRKDTRVVLANQREEALEVILKKCDEVGIKTINNCKIELNAVDSINGKAIVTFITENEIYPDVNLGLRGRHQIENARLALQLAEVLKNNFNFTLSKSEIVEGLETAEHKGRLEFYQNILFDGAHNVAGAKALKEYLDEFINQPVTLVFGAMRDKDLSPIAAILFPKAETLILTKPNNERSMETSELLKIVPTAFDQKNVKLAETVAEAITTAKLVTKETELILITGSLYLVGEAQEILKSAF